MGCIPTLPDRNRIANRRFDNSGESGAAGSPGSGAQAPGSPAGNAELAGLDQVASGFHGFEEGAGFEDDGGLSIVFDFEQDDFGSDCFGETDDTTAAGVPYGQYVNFPDRDTMILSAKPNIGGFTMELKRQ